MSDPPMPLKDTVKQIKKNKWDFKWKIFDDEKKL